MPQRLGAGLNAYPFLPTTAPTSPAAPSSEVSTQGSTLAIPCSPNTNKGHKRSLPSSPPTTHAIPCNFFRDWASCFGSDRDSVPWPEFFSKFNSFEDSNAPNSSVYADVVTAQREVEYNRLRNGLFLKHALRVGNYLTCNGDPTSTAATKEEKDELVTRENFQDFLLLFGPIVPSKEYQVMSRVLEAMTQDGFLGFISTGEAERRARESRGYLIRFSASEAGKFTVTKFLRETGRVIHYRISVESTPQGGRLFKLSRSNVGTSWAQIREILQLTPPVAQPDLNHIIEAQIRTILKQEVEKQKYQLCKQHERIRLADSNEGLFSSNPRSANELRRLFEDQFNFSGIQVRAVPLHPYILKQSKSSAHVLFEAVMGDIRVPTGMLARQPFNLALVVDRSSSMAPVLKTACMALKRIVESMTPEDVLHLVAYSDNAEVLISNGQVKNESDKQTLFEAIDSISSRGSTNISTGLETARKLINDAKGLGQEYSSRIFLFSDGQPNRGITTLGALSELAQTITESDGIRISSFGIGVAFDEAIMKAISDYGGGDYFFIQGESNIADVIERGFESILRLVGTSGFLKIVPACDGVSVKHIYGEPTLVTKEGTKMGDIRKLDLMQVLMELEIDSSAVTSGTQPIVNLEFSFEPLYLARIAELETKFSTSASVCFTEGISPQLGDQNDDVVVCLGLRQCSEIEATLLKLVDTCKFEEALELKRKELRLLRKINEVDRRFLVERKWLSSQKAFLDLREKLFESQLRSLESATLGCIDNLGELRKEMHYEGYYYNHYSNF